MKHYIYYSCLGLLIFLCFSLTGCGQQSADTDISTYFVIDSTREYSAELPVSPKVTCDYASQYAVIPATDPVSSNAAVKLCINNTDNTVVDSVNPFEKIYPASITKIMTTLLVLEQGDLSDEYTVTEAIDLNDPMAVSLGLQVGDTISVEELLYGLLLESANDYAVALGRYVAGNDEAFVKMMNERAAELGATHTHFVNPNGLHDNDHYTTGYDLYLIFQELITHEEFLQISGQATHVLHYTDADGNTIEKDLSSSDQFVTGEYSVPEGYTVVGGKTGTTNEAGYCLILDVRDTQNNDYIVLVCGASSRSSLYSMIKKEIEQISN